MPPALNQTLLPYNMAPRWFLLNNDTSSAVTYTATFSNNTVPLCGAVDSITGGVTYAWDEISATGYPLQPGSHEFELLAQLRLWGQFGRQ